MQDLISDMMTIYLQVYIACGFGPKDPYRKPKTGMWHVMEQHFNSGISVDMDQLFLSLLCVNCLFCLSHKF